MKGKTKNTSNLPTKEEMNQGFLNVGALVEDVREQLKAVAEQHLNLNKKLDRHQEILESHTEMIGANTIAITANTIAIGSNTIATGNLAENIEIIKDDIRTIKNDLKQKVDRSEFSNLGRRVAVLERKR